MADVVSFLIGLLIIIGASILNAAGLNLSKLDHLRNSRSGRKEWQRPLLICGMALYCISQLLGSTLALEYMRAEYVAPLGSTSLVFNFIFARFLVGTQITSLDIWGTIVIIVGVCGIVGFGSWNSGINDEMDVERLTLLWRRGGWLAYFFTITGILLAMLISSSILEALLNAREELTSVPTSGTRRNADKRTGVIGWIVNAKIKWDNFILWLTERLEVWTASRSNKQIAWTLGACTGGGLAGGTLIFAKVIVKLLSGTWSHRNAGNQFGAASSIFTLILLCITAVLQILCLNRGLRVYDSTLVVPVSHSNCAFDCYSTSLEVDAYHGWTLFLIFLSMVILIGGVVLLTHKKPDPVPGKGGSSPDTASSIKRSDRSREPSGSGEGEEEVLWAVGNDSDDEDDGKTPRQSGQLDRANIDIESTAGLNKAQYSAVDQNPQRSGEGQRLMDGDDDDDDDDHTNLMEVPLSR
ncbi:hypothetical protein DL96DRAFT_1709332 [Flagelloscypha sp. PMI_526]|nr:hypothetical protein DL96DRAFT_1709332 [Flagelloscypha sp. PMI_526]